MSQSKELKQRVLNVSGSKFEELAIDIFHYQYFNNPVYKQFVDFLNKDISRIDSVSKIPFIPISFFKNHKIISGNSDSYLLFESSGTTGSKVSKHYISDVDFYKKLSVQLFEEQYGKLEGYIILALLPSYLERSTSSLVYMVEEFIQHTNDERSGFYLNNLEQLAAILLELKKSTKKILLIGVTFALLDLAEEYDLDLSNVVIMETGGMKGRRDELVRSQVHDILKNSFCLDLIHSEYGMTELLSQSYSCGSGIFTESKSMKVFIREPQDPFNLNYNRAGGVNVVDLGNVDSCSFIATDDIGRLLPHGGFEIIGRLDNSDIRGCNLMVV